MTWCKTPGASNLAKYSDLKPKVMDARIFPDDGKHPGGWGTILIGGMGFGGGEISVNDDFDMDFNYETRTFRPENDVCSFGGDSYLYALYFESGTAYKKSFLGTKEVGSDTVNLKVADLGKGKSSEVGIHSNRLGRRNRLKLITQMSSGVVDQRDAFAIDVNARIVGWMQQ